MYATVCDNAVVIIVLIKIRRTINQAGVLLKVVVNLTFRCSSIFRMRFYVHNIFSSFSTPKYRTCSKWAKDRGKSFMYFLFHYFHRFP